MNNNENLKGVFTAYKKDGSKYYRSNITYQNKHISLGSFNEANKANSAYLDAQNIIEDNTISINDVLQTVDNYTLSLDKIVSLINFRDNHIYSPNPFYLSGKIIYYYLSENEILKFDIDDLFFYSNHRIQKRGGHLFVADCGNQINLVNRYGIKNHAVCGKDYIFVNGDSLDFRHSNIEILNEYQGVHLLDENQTINFYKLSKKRSKKALYKALIHINGNYIIGIYDSKEKAAIAYNKAADILAKNGCKINFTRNTISNMTNKKYNSIYEKIEISEEILKINF